MYKATAPMSGYVCHKLPPCPKNSECRYNKADFTEFLLEKLWRHYGQRNIANQGANVFGSAPLLSVCGPFVIRLCSLAEKYVVWLSTHVLYLWIFSHYGDSSILRKETHGFCTSDSGPMVLHFFSITAEGSSSPYEQCTGHCATITNPSFHRESPEPSA